MSHSQCIPRTLLQVTSAPVCDHWIAKQGQYHVEVEFIPKPLMWLHIYETIYHCWLKDIGVLIRNSHIFTILEITWEAIFSSLFLFAQVLNMVMRKIIIMMIIKIMTATWGSEATLLTDEFGKTHWAYLAKTFFFLS